MVTTRFFMLVGVLVASVFVTAEAEAAHRAQVSGVIVGVDDDSRQLVLAVPRGDDVIRVRVFVPRDAPIIEVDADGRERIRFSELERRDSVGVRGRLIRRGDSMILVARFVVKDSRD